MSSGLLARVARKLAQAAPVDFSRSAFAESSESVRRRRALSVLAVRSELGQKEAGDFAGFVEDGAVGERIVGFFEAIAAAHEQSAIIDIGGFS